jgi:hypothetical protein
VQRAVWVARSSVASPLILTLDFRGSHGVRLLPAEEGKEDAEAVVQRACLGPHCVKVACVAQQRHPDRSRSPIYFCLTPAQAFPLVASLRSQRDCRRPVPDAGGGCGVPTQTQDRLDVGLPCLQPPHPSCLSAQKQRGGAIARGHKLIDNAFPPVPSSIASAGGGQMVWRRPVGFLPVERVPSPGESLLAHASPCDPCGGGWLMAVLGALAASSLLGRVFDTRFCPASCCSTAAFGSSVPLDGAYAFRVFDPAAAADGQLSLWRAVVRPLRRSPLTLCCRRCWTT